MTDLNNRDNDNYRLKIDDKMNKIGEQSVEIEGNILFLNQK